MLSYAVRAFAGKEKLAITFEESFGSDAMVLPGVGEVTTTKTRSILHGQCYDKNKCLKTVIAPKDRLVANAGALHTYLVTPDIARIALPHRGWASDHCLVTAGLRFAPLRSEEVGRGASEEKKE